MSFNVFLGFGKSHQGVELLAIELEHGHVGLSVDEIDVEFVYACLYFDINFIIFGVHFQVILSFLFDRIIGSISSILLFLLYKIGVFSNLSNYLLSGLINVLRHWFDIHKLFDTIDQHQKSIWFPV